MYSNIFFLMVILILITMGSEITVPIVAFNSSLIVFSYAIVLYFFTVTLIYSQNIRLGKVAIRHKNKMLILANLELCLYFIAYYFIFGIQRLFLFKNFILAGSFSVAFALLLYLAGLGTFYYAQNSMHIEKNHAFNKSKMQVSFLIPFLLPFLMYKVLSDLAILIPWKSFHEVTGILENSYEEAFAFFLFGVIFVVIMTAILPQAIIQCWGCKDLKDKPLQDRLTALCRQANFKHAGLKSWDIMQDTMTAAIIGIWKPCRYVLFTPSLLHKLSPQAIRAILAHEIGHSKCRHLLMYPFILGGILLAASLLASPIYDHMMDFFEVQTSFSRTTQTSLSYLIFFLAFTSVMAILFRYVFGYFSRLFERQADLYIFKLGIPAEFLIEAFNGIATASGNIPNAPNWHHYSIQQRIDFLKIAEKNPSLINAHHRKVAINLIVYFACFATLLYFIFYTY